MILRENWVAFWLTKNYLCLSVILIQNSMIFLLQKIVLVIFVTLAFSELTQL